MSDSFSPSLIKPEILDGVAVRVRGLRLIKPLDGETVLAEAAGGWTLGSTVELGLDVKGDALIGYIDGKPAIEASDPDHAFKRRAGTTLSTIGMDHRAGVDSIHCRGPKRNPIRAEMHISNCLPATRLEIGVPRRGFTIDW